MKKNSNSRICIIGAGAAGLSMAYYLKEKGYSEITILEKNGHIGGKCYSEKKYGQANGMGAIAIIPYFKNTIKLITKYGLAMEPSPVNVLIDSSNGYQYPLRYYFRSMNKLKTGVAIVKYLCHILILNRSLRKTGYHSKNKELAAPFSQWLEAKGLSRLKELFCIPITCFGYGYLYEIPAIYALKYMNFTSFMLLLYLGFADILGLKPRWTKMLVNGMEQLMEALADEVDNVRLNVKVLKVNRVTESNKISIKIKQGKRGKVESLIFDYLVVTVPPSTANLGFMDLRDDEIEIFNKVKVRDYYSILCEVKDMSRNFFLPIVDNRKICLPRPGHPFIIAKVWSESDLAAFYTYSNEKHSEKYIREKLEQFMNSINRNLLDVLKIKKWDYFPHFESDDLSDGIYDKLDGIQGGDNTFYAGGLMNFELVENVIEYSKFLVKKYF